MTRSRTARAGFDAVAIGALLVGIGVLVATTPPYTPGRAYWALPVMAGVPLIVVPVLVWFHRRTGSRGHVHKQSRKSARNDGLASSWDIHRAGGRGPARRKAKVLRPSIGALPIRQRVRVRTKQVATPLARVGLQRLHALIEEVTVVAGGPRVGKSATLVGFILDAPGAVISTSTRTDLLENTQRLRGKHGPTYVFNPSGIGKLASTIGFDPLDGCTDPVIAEERAEDLLGGLGAPGSGDDRAFWANQAHRNLATLMHAAALGGLSMREVLGWVSAPDRAKNEVLAMLRRSEQPSYEAAARQFFEMNDRTRSSVCATIMPALGWLTSATATAAATARPGRAQFDVARLLAESGTVYLLGAEDGRVAPLVAALTGYIAREARRIAGEQPAGRLDPPLTLCLDEAAIICPIPLDRWTADMGGRNVQIHIAFQSRAQLRQRWGDTGAAAILNNATNLLIFGGITDRDDLDWLATLIGNRDEQTASRDTRGQVTSYSTRRVPILEPAQIQQLRPGRVVIIRRGMPAAIGRARMGWKRLDVRLDKLAQKVEAYQSRRAERRADVTAVARLFDDQPAANGTAQVRAIAPGNDLESLPSNETGDGAAGGPGQTTTSEGDVA